jgi:hypothetical protein
MDALRLFFKYTSIGQSSPERRGVRKMCGRRCGERMHARLNAAGYIRDSVNRRSARSRDMT